MRWECGESLSGGICEEIKTGIGQVSGSHQGVTESHFHYDTKSESVRVRRCSTESETKTG